MRLRRLWLSSILLLLGAGYCIRNPERRWLTDSVRESAPGKFATLPDGKTHYEVGGPEGGQRVVLVHGFSVPMYIWDSTFVALTGAGYRVLRYDTYGRGFSDRPRTSYALSLFDRQLTGLLDTLGWREPVHLVGLSFGGPVTATFVAEHAQRVRSWTLVDPAAGAQRAMPSYLGWPIIGEVLWQMAVVPNMADGQASDFVHPEKWPDWSDRYRVQQRYFGFGRALLRTRLDNQGGRLDSLYARAGRSRIPTLLLWGVEDKTVPISEAAGIQAVMPPLEFQRIDNAGHLPHMEQSALTHRLLIAHLQRNGQ
ncbi:MAG: alpha/beta fold hydrolase [Gemmatimonadaceae bacterium]|nr:alpha/beta fold hydrolase [Gemmatimonadaceae bacterium]